MALLMKKRKYVRRRRAPARSSALPFRRKGPVRRRRIPSAPKNHMMVALQYSEVVRLNTTSAIPNVVGYVYRLNDLFDPNYSGVGHQPYFRDQLFSLYETARVLSAKIKVIFTPIENQYPVEVLVGPIQSGFLDTDFSTAVERKGTRHAMLPTQTSRTLTCYSTVDYYFGQKKGSTMRDSDHKQTSAASLSTDKSMWYQILVQNSTGNVQNVLARVEITMYSRFEEPLHQAGS